MRPAASRQGRRGSGIREFPNVFNTPRGVLSISTPKPVVHFPAMKPRTMVLAVLLVAAVLPIHVRAEEPAKPLLLPASELLPPSTWIDDQGLRLLSHRARLGLTRDDSPALRFGATRFTAEGPWADLSFRRDDGRTVRVWLVDDAGPPPLLGDTRDPWDMQLRWSFSSPKKK